MDAFQFDNVKAEKANAILHYNRLRIITKLFRFIELCLCLVLLSWTSSRLPSAVRIAGEYFRQFISAVLSPLFIFVIGNVIILALLFKSGHLSPASSADATTIEGDDLYEEFIAVSSENSAVAGFSEEKEAVFDDKETIFEVNRVKVSDHDGVDVMETEESDKGLSKRYRRSKSENLQREIVLKESGRELRRTKTEKCQSVEAGGDTVEAVEEEHVFDGLSNEEFQKKIEAFIAKQVKFHQEEKLAIVLHTQG